MSSPEDIVRVTRKRQRLIEDLLSAAATERQVLYVGPNEEPTRFAPHSDPLIQTDKEAPVVIVSAIPSAVSGLVGIAGPLRCPALLVRDRQRGVFMVGEDAKMSLVQRLLARFWYGAVVAQDGPRLTIRAPWLRKALRRELEGFFNGKAAGLPTASTPPETPSAAATPPASQSSPRTDDDEPRRSP